MHNPISKLSSGNITPISQDKDISHIKTPHITHIPYQNCQVGQNPHIKTPHITHISYQDRRAGAEPRNETPQT